MIKKLPFDEHVAEYDSWFENHPFVFETELAAIRKILPQGEHLMSLEIGSATGRFSGALGIREALDSSSNMCKAAEERGVHTFTGYAEELPYESEQFDFVLMTTCISYIENIKKAFTEAYRVLKPDGTLIVGFIEKNSRIGKNYKTAKKTSRFYKQARFYSVHEVESELIKAGFNRFHISQTLFNDLDNIKSVEPSIPGYGEGSYVLIRAAK